MRAHSALVVHPDAGFRIALGRCTRRAEHAVFLAADAAEARELLERRPGLRVVAVAPEAGGEELARELRAGRPELEVFVLGARESSAPVRSGLDLRIERALGGLDRRRERRLGELFSQRWRRRAAQAAQRLAAERLERWAPLPAAAGGEVSP